MSGSLRIPLTIILTGAFCLALYAEQLRKRSPFEIPLVKLKIYEDHEMVNEMHDYEQDNPFKKVRVYQRESEDYALISHYQDQMISIKRRGIEKDTYLEPQRDAMQISRFEAQQLTVVVESLISTLAIFEHDLQMRTWGRVLYLDGYLPRFLHNFYYLNRCILNSRDALPEVTFISPDEFDYSHNSYKSDDRIRQWEEKRNYISKLHKSTQNLIFHLKRFNQNTLGEVTRKRAVVDSYDRNTRQAYEEFILLYFNKY